MPALWFVVAGGEVDGLGDVVAGITAPLVARRLAQGGADRAAMRFNAFGKTGRGATAALVAPARKLS